MWSLYGVFKDGEDDRESIVEGAKPFWIREALARSAFVVYDEDGIYVDSVDPIETIYHVDNFLYIDHCNVGLFKVNIEELLKNNYTVNIEYALFEYENKRGNISSEDIVISRDDIYIQK